MSIFTLKESVDELTSSNAGMSRMLYEQHAPTRDVTGNNFPNGAIHTRFQVSGTKWWIPSRSYIRMRCSITDAAGNQLPLSSEIGANMGLMSNLFQNGEFRISDKTVSRVSSYMAQVDAHETRTGRSKAWIDSVGSSFNMWESSYEERKNKISSDGANGKYEFEKVGRLALGFEAVNTVSIAVDTGLLTFADGGGALPAASPFRPGDEIEIDVGGATGTVRYRISAVPTAATLQLNNVKTPLVVAAVREFRRVRPKSSRQVKTFELVWQPPFSIFKIDHALPAGKYSMVLNPQSAQQYQKAAIESLTDKGAGVDFTFNVVDMYTYIATVDGDRVDDKTYLVDLEETRCQVEDFSSAGSITQKNFDVSPSTFALTVAFQDEAAGSLTQYSASKFKVRPPAPAPGALPSTVGQDLNLQRLYVNYAGMNKPQPDADPSYVVGDAKDYTTQRYAESIIQTGGYFESGGVETLQEWQERGPYYYFTWPRDGADRSTRATVNANFSAIANARVLLFDHYKSFARITVKDGQVTDVEVQEA